MTTNDFECHEAVPQVNHVHSWPLAASNTTEGSLEVKRPTHGKMQQVSPVRRKKIHAPREGMTKTDTDTTLVSYLHPVYAIYQYIMSSIYHPLSTQCPWSVATKPGETKRREVWFYQLWRDNAIIPAMQHGLSLSMSVLDVLRDFRAH